MDVITTSLEALIQRITSTPNTKLDTAAIDAFCIILGKEADGVQIASKLLATHIQSTNEAESLQALILLDMCMRKCGRTFHAEVGKFRFLNEMIKLVSPKYLGNKTPSAVRQKILELLKTWTQEYPREVKIKEAYEMLKKQGVVKDEPSPNANNKNHITKTHKAKKSLLEDEETSKLLQELLQSKDPFELQLANRLIKSMVKDDEQTQQTSQINLEVESALNNVRLLSEMLDSYNPTQTNSEDIDLIKELHQACEGFKPSLLKLADETQDNEDMLGEVLTVNDELSQVFEKYASKMNPSDRSQANGNNDMSLLDLSCPVETASAIPQPTDNQTSNQRNLMSSPQSDMEMLSDIFTTTNTVDPSLITDSNLLLSNDDIMQPITISPKSKAESSNVPVKVNTKAKALEDLNEIGKLLLQQSLSRSNLKDDATEKKPESISNKPTESINDICKRSKKDEVGNDSQTLSKVTSKDDENKMIMNNEIVVESNSIETKVKLTDINITLEDIKPSNTPPMTVIDEKNGVSVILHFADGSPRPDVSVIVVKTMSSSNALTKYLFQAVVPKACKCRLQQPSNTELPAHNPFLPPSAITQIMLIANPQKVPVSLKFMLSYMMDDEPMTEMGEVESLPIT